MKTTKERSIQRIKIIMGQLAGLERQIEADASCMDILTQSLAIQKSLSSLSKLVLSGHLETHISDMLASGDEKKREKALKELAQFYELTNVRGK
jgi:DNA-binding FrmR family transcriptional regulator